MTVYLAMPVWKKGLEKLAQLLLHFCRFCHSQNWSVRLCPIKCQPLHRKWNCLTYRRLRHKLPIVSLLMEWFPKIVIKFYWVILTLIKQNFGFKAHTNGNSSPPNHITSKTSLSPSPPGPHVISRTQSFSNSSDSVPLNSSVRQISKLKRFLTTLHQFANDISPEVGERVRVLIFGLVVCNAIIFRSFF